MKNKDSWIVCFFNWFSTEVDVFVKYRGNLNCLHFSIDNLVQYCVEKAILMKIF